MEGKVETLSRKRTKENIMKENVLKITMSNQFQHVKKGGEIKNTEEEITKEIIQEISQT